jgi:hypothetical protein
VVKNYESPLTGYTQVQLGGYIFILRWYRESIEEKENRKKRGREYTTPPHSQRINAETAGTSGRRVGGEKRRGRGVRFGLRADTRLISRVKMLGVRFERSSHETHAVCCWSLL